MGIPIWVGIIFMVIGLVYLALVLIARGVLSRLIYAVDKALEEFKNAWKDSSHENRK